MDRRHIEIWSMDVGTVHKHMHINTFMAFYGVLHHSQLPVLGLDNNHLPSSGMRRVWLWIGPWSALGFAVDEMFIGAFCVASKIPLSVNDGSCEDASGKCDSNYGCLVSCSVQCQLLRQCSTPVSMTDCGWGKHVSGENDAERSKGWVQLWLHLWQIMANSSSCSWMLGLRLHHPNLWQVWLSIWDEHNSVFSVWAAAEGDRLWWEWFWWSKQLWLLVQQVITLVVFASWGRGCDEHGDNKCDWLQLWWARLS